MIASYQLDFSQKQIIVNALLECACLKSGRDVVAAQLHQDIRQRLMPNPNSQTASFLDLVDGCLQFGGGIEELLRIIGFLEGKNSRAFETVCLAVLEARFLCQTKLPGGALAELKTQLDELNHLESRLDRIVNASLRGGPALDPFGRLTLHTAFLELALLGGDYGISFLQRLTREDRAEAQAREIHGWMERHATQLGVSLESVRADIEKKANQAVCILLKIEENRMEDDHFLMQAWGWRGEEEGAIPIELDAKLEEESRFGKGHPVAKLDGAVREAIRAAKYQYGAADVVVELFVERKLFGQAIGGWEIHVGESSRARLVNKHPVFLRWLNRYGPRRRDYGEWKKKWEQVKTVSRPAVEWSPVKDSHQPEEITNGWAADDRGLCLALGYVPPPRREGDLLDAVRDCGTPILCWVNPIHDGEDLVKETFESMLQDSRLADLPTHFLKLRQTGHGNDPAHPVHRLVLLFDDADRELPAPVGYRS